MNTKKNKSILAIVAAMLVLVSSIAYFTDFKVNKMDGALGTLGITTKLNGDSLENLAPGDTKNLTLDVQNAGSLDGLVRTTYIINSVGAFSTGELTLVVDGEEVLTGVNKSVTVGNDSLAAGSAVQRNIELKLSSQIGNNLQEAQFEIEILTEVAQARNNATPNWTTLGTETVSFGGSSHNVVPAK